MLMAGAHFHQRVHCKAMLMWNGSYDLCLKVKPSGDEVYEDDPKGTLPVFVGKHKHNFSTHYCKARYYMVHQTLRQVQLTVYT